MKELMDTKGAITGEATAGRRVRRTYPLEEKLRIVDQTKQPGMSVSRVARESGVNTNLVFTWRRQYAPEGLTPAGRIESRPYAIARNGPKCDNSARCSTVAVTRLRLLFLRRADQIRLSPTRERSRREYCGCDLARTICTSECERISRTGRYFGGTGHADQAPQSGADRRQAAAN